MEKNLNYNTERVLFDYIVFYYFLLASRRGLYIEFDLTYIFFNYV